MDSKLFAFQLAGPIATTDHIPLESTYDPRTQTAVWTGSGSATAAYYCTYIGGNMGGRQYCSAYGNYCTTYGAKYYVGGYFCDVPL